METPRGELSVNVGGSRHVLPREVLHRLPDSLLAGLLLRPGGAPRPGAAARVARCEAGETKAAGTAKKRQADERTAEDAAGVARAGDRREVESDASGRRGTGAERAGGCDAARADEAVDDGVRETGDARGTRAETETPPSEAGATASAAGPESATRKRAARRLRAKAQRASRRGGETPRRDIHGGAPQAANARPGDARAGDAHRCTGPPGSGNRHAHNPPRSSSPAASTSSSSTSSARASSPPPYDDFDAESGEFFFDRDPRAFERILDAFYSGEVHMERAACPVCFKQEMDFWGVGADRLDACCRFRYYELREELDEVVQMVETELRDSRLEGGGGGGDRSRCERARAGVWQLMEKPDSSRLARSLALASFAFVVISSVVMCLGTVPELQAGPGEEHPTLAAVETACIGWFTVEFALRLFSAPDRAKFMSSPLNVIDLLAVLPYYVVLALTATGGSVLGLASAQQGVQALRVMRVARIFKLARHSSGLQTLTYALRSSFKELGLLLMYLGVGVYLFSALGYTVERSHPETLFRSIPHSFWWAIITMTTVGYGDVYPKTELGKVNAAVSFLCGILAIALPIHPIINNFVKFYNKQRVLEAAAKHQLELLRVSEKLAGEMMEAAGARERDEEEVMVDAGGGGGGGGDVARGGGEGSDGEVGAGTNDRCCCNGHLHGSTRRASQSSGRSRIGHGNPARPHAVTTKP